MKKSLKVLALAFVMLLSSGCVKSSVTMKVNSDKSMDYSYIIGISKEIRDLAKSYGSEEEVDISEMFSDEDKKEAEENGYEVKEYDDDKFFGVVVSKHFANIDELIADDDTNVSIDLTEDKDAKIFKVEKSFFGNTYKAKIAYDEAKDLSEGMDEYKEDEDYSQYLEGMDISFTLEVDGKIISNNATSVDGNKLTWDFTKFKENAIEFEFKIPNKTNIILLYSGIGVVVLAVAVCVVVAIKKKKN